MHQLKSTYEPDPVKESVRAATVTDVECDASAIRWSTGTTGGATQGVHGWRVNAQATSHEVTGGVTRQVTAADATDGIVTLKLVYQLDDTDSRDLRGTTNARARVEIINLGWPRA